MVSRIVWTLLKLGVMTEIRGSCGTLVIWLCRCGLRQNFHACLLGNMLRPAHSPVDGNAQGNDARERRQIGVKSAETDYIEYGAGHKKGHQNRLDLPEPWVRKDIVSIEQSERGNNEPKESEDSKNTEWNNNRKWPAVIIAGYDRPFI